MTQLCVKLETTQTKCLRHLRTIVCIRNRLAACPQPKQTNKQQISLLHVSDHGLHGQPRLGVHHLAVPRNVPHHVEHEPGHDGGVVDEENL